MRQCINFNFSLPFSNGSHVPIIALMNNGFAYENRADLYTKGITDFLSPPLIAHELLSKVKLLLHDTQCVCLFKPDFHFFSEQALQHQGSSITQKDKQLVHETCQFLQQRLDKKLNLDEIAISMGTNRSKLALLYKAVVGVSVFEWLREQRLLKAKKLLLNSELTIQEIGFEVGFENSANFSTAYKKYFHISPRFQRKLIRENSDNNH